MSAGRCELGPGRDYRPGCTKIRKADKPKTWPESGKEQERLILLKDPYLTLLMAVMALTRAEETLLGSCEVYLQDANGRRLSWSRPWDGEFDSFRDELGD